jgi:iron complex outermembrane recepter protein
MKIFGVSHTAIIAASFSTSLFLSVPGLARAEDAIRQDIIVTGEKTSGDFGEKSGIPIAKLPQSVQVLTSDDLTNRGVRSIGDALRAVPSASVGTSRVSAYQSFSLKIRGFLADQMRNGVRQRYYEDVDASALSNVDRIEVLKGPSSVLFGQSAVGGIVSIVTKRPQKEFGGSVSGTLGTDDRKSGSFDLTGPVADALYFRTTGEIERSGSFVDFQDEDRENLSLSLTYEASDQITAYFVAEWLERRSSRYPGLPVVGTVVSNGVADISNERFLSEPSFSNLESYAPLVQAWVDFKVNDSWTITPRLSYSGFDTNFQQIRVRAVDADGVTVNRNGRFGTEDDDYTIVQLDANGSFNLGGVRHKLLVGVEYDRERSTFNQFALTNAGAINALNPSYVFQSGVAPALDFAFYGKWDVDALAFYVQDQIDLTDRWNVILGARQSNFDFKSSFEDPSGVALDKSSTDGFVYQVGTTYRLDDRWSIFGGYNTGFDLESVAGSRSRTGEQFEPEESDQYEAGVRYAGDSLRGSLSIFQVRKTNALTADPVDPDFSIQTGEFRVRGVEIEGYWQATDALSVQAGYAFMDSKVTRSNNGDQGDDIADVPEHQANLFVSYAVPDTKLVVRGGVNYVGERRFSNGRVSVSPALLASDVRLPEYVTVDLGASYTLGKTRLDLSVTNLFDEEYYTREFNDFSVFPGDPLAVNFRVSQSF